MISDDDFVNSLISLVDSLTNADGIIIEEGVAEAVMEYSIMVDGDEEIAAAVVTVTGEVLEYSVVSRDGRIEDSIVSLDSKVIEGTIDSVRDFVVTVVIVFSIAMTWESVLVTVNLALFAMFEDVENVAVGL